MAVNQWITDRNAICRIFFKYIFLAQRQTQSSSLNCVIRLKQWREKEGRREHFIYTFIAFYKRKMLQRTNVFGSLKTFLLFTFCIVQDYIWSRQINWNSTIQTKCNFIVFWFLLSFDLPACKRCSLSDGRIRKMLGSINITLNFNWTLQFTYNDIT